jgi:Stigma-specific protein, Stig1
MRRSREALTVALVTSALACRPSDTLRGAMPVDGATIACLPTTPTTCGGQCTDLASDPYDCGACGHACAATAACIRGACGPEVTTVVPSAPGCEALDLVIADGTLYWTDVGHGSVNRVRLDGSAPTILAANEVRPGRLAVSGSTVFWATGTTAMGPAVSSTPTSTSVSVRALTSGGGAPVDLVVERDPGLGVLGLVVSEDGLTVTYAIGTQVKAVPVAGGAPVVVYQAALNQLPAALSKEGDTIAVATIGGAGSVEAFSLVDGAIASCAPPDPTDGGRDPGGATCTQLSDNSAAILTKDVLLRQGDVIWADASNLVVAPADKSLVPRALATVVNLIAGFVAGPSDLYFADGKLVERVSFLTSAPTVITLARGQNATGSMAVDVTRVAWSNADCSIAATAP